MQLKKQATARRTLEHASLPAPALLLPPDAGRPVDGVFLPFHHIRSNTDWGIGDFHTAKMAVEFCSAMNLHLLALLPVTYSGAFHSPYSVASSRALDPEYMSIEALIENIERSGVSMSQARRFVCERDAEIQSLRSGERINHEKIINLKLEASQLIWTIVSRHQDCDIFEQYLSFVDENRSWLEDHLLYLELKREFQALDEDTGWDWRSWDRYQPGLSARLPSTIIEARRRHCRNLEFSAFVQFVLHLQFEDLVAYGKQHNIHFMVDIPFSPPEADVWINPALVGLKYENGFRRMETQGVPAKKECPVGQNWQFSSYDWSNPDAIEFFCDTLRWHHKFGAYIRFDHVLGFYRSFLYQQDVDETQTLERLGLYGPLQEIRREALDKNSDDAKQSAIEKVSALIRKKLSGSSSSLSEEVRRLLFDESGQTRSGGNMIMVARKVTAATPSQKLPLGSVWQRWTQIEDCLFKQQPVWDYIRISPNERACDEGFLMEYLFPNDGTEPPLPTDDLRVAYYRLAPAEKILSELMRIADQQGSILILETLGTVPADIEHSTRRSGGYNFIPVIWGLERSSRYHPTHFIKNALATFSVADSGSLDAAWQELPPQSKLGLAKNFFACLPDEEIAEHLFSLTSEVHEKLLQMVYSPSTIFPELPPASAPLLVMTGLHDLTGYPEQYRLNRPGEINQWAVRLPEEVCIEHLLASSQGMQSTEKAGQVIRLLRSLKESRDQSAPPAKTAQLLRVRPDVDAGVIQIREINSESDRVAPFLIKATISGLPKRVEAVLVDQGRLMHRFAMQALETDPLSDVTCWAIAIRPADVSTYSFHVELIRDDGTVETSKEGRLYAVPSGADLNPLSPHYCLKALTGR